ncbi:hypothetical protein Tco_1316816 [Tanacetum coccineum]
MASILFSTKHLHHLHPSDDILVSISSLDPFQPNVSLSSTKPPQSQLQATTTTTLPHHINFNKVHQRSASLKRKDPQVGNHGLVQHDQRTDDEGSPLLSDMKETLLQRMLEENYDKGHAEHRIAYEALQGSIHRDEDEDFDDDKAQKETKKKSTTGASDYAQAPPPPPPVSSTRQEHQSTGTAAPSSSKTAASAEYSAWTTTDSQTKPSSQQFQTISIRMKDTTADVQAKPGGNLSLKTDRPLQELLWTIPSSDLSMPTNN